MSIQLNPNARKYSILYSAPPLGIPTTESSFSFDPPPSPRSARSAEKSTTLFSFEPAAVASNEPYVSNKSFKTRTSVENKENVRTSDNRRMSKDANGSSKKERRSFKCERLSNIFSTKESSSASASTSNKEKSESATKTRKVNSAPVHRKNSSISQSKFENDDDSASTGTSSDLTMFPFDREAIDYERIQRECFAVEEEDDDSFVARKSFPYDFDTEDSPSYEAFDQKVPPEGIFQQYAILSQLEQERQSKKRLQSPAAEMKALTKIEHINKKLNETSALIHDQPSSNVTSPIPDLKIDFFSSGARSSFSRENGNEKTSDALDGCQKDSTSSFGSKSGNNNTSSNKSTATNGSINLTSNPMSTAVVTTPRATIVVQQVCSLTFPFSDSCVLCLLSLIRECEFPFKPPIK